MAIGIESALNHFKTLFCPRGSHATKVCVFLAFEHGRIAGESARSGRVRCGVFVGLFVAVSERGESDSVETLKNPIETVPEITGSSMADHDSVLSPKCRGSYFGRLGNRMLKFLGTSLRLSILQAFVSNRSVFLVSRPFHRLFFRFCSGGSTTRYHSCGGHSRASVNDVFRILVVSHILYGCNSTPFPTIRQCGKRVCRGAEIEKSKTIC